MYLRRMPFISLFGQAVTAACMWSVVIGQWHIQSMYSRYIAEGKLDVEAHVIFIEHI